MKTEIAQHIEDRERLRKELVDVAEATVHHVRQCDEQFAALAHRHISYRDAVEDILESLPPSEQVEQLRALQEPNMPRVALTMGALRWLTYEFKEADPPNYLRYPTVSMMGEQVDVIVKRREGLDPDELLAKEREEKAALAAKLREAEGERDAWAERARELLEENGSLKAILPCPGGNQVLMDALAGRSERIHQERRREWSRRTFPNSTALGPLLHLREEVEETILAYETSDLVGPQALREELADCRLLLDDAVERAGITRAEHREDRIAKLAINERREWTVGPDGAGRHVKAAQA